MTAWKKKAKQNLGVELNAEEEELKEGGEAAAKPKPSFGALLSKAAVP